MAQWVSVQVDGDTASFSGYAHTYCAGEYAVQGITAKFKRVWFGEQRGLECAQCVDLSKAEMKLWQRTFAH